MNDEHYVDWFRRGLKGEICPPSATELEQEALSFGIAIRTKRTGRTFEDIAALESNSTRDQRYALLRIIGRVPELTLVDLSKRAEKPTKWVVHILGLDRKLHDEVGKLLRTSEISVAWAFELSKLPKDHQVGAYESTKGLSILGLIKEINALKEALK